MKYIILFILSASITSCYHVYYAPNTLNSPLLTEKDEMRINAMYTAGAVSDYMGGEVQVAYAIENNWGIMFNGFSAGRSEITGDYIEKGNGTYVEFGGGYFKPLSKKEQWIFEAFGGFGGGNAKNDYGLGDHSKVGVTKFFIQPAIGFKSKYFEFSAGARMGVVNWKVKENNILNSEHDYEKSEMIWIQEKPSFFVIEPGLLIRGGSKNVKAQLGFTISNSNRSGIPYFTDLTESFNLNLGISFNFQRLK